MLASDIFGHTTSPKKAAGRALGTLVELITFYMIRDWNLENYLAIERKLPEYGNPEITHNVEFSLHSSRRREKLTTPPTEKTLTATRIIKAAEAIGIEFGEFRKGHSSLLRGDLLRHAAVFAETADTF